MNISDQDKRTNFLTRLASMPIQSQRHLLNMENVAELHRLQELASGLTREIIDSMLGDLDSKHDLLVRALSFEEVLYREVYNPKISDAEYFERCCKHHGIQ